MSNNVSLVPQDKSNACWLASSTMMRSWKDQQCYTMADTLSFLDGGGGNFTQTYNADNGLSFSDVQTIVNTLGLTALPPASYTIDYFFSLLASSPVMAVIMFSATSNIAHMVVIADISGDRTPAGTTLLIDDPLPLNAGHTYNISFADFLSKFEAVVAYENNLGTQDLTSQLFYYQSSGLDGAGGGGDGTDASSTETAGEASTGN